MAPLAGRAEHRLKLGGGFELRCSMDRLDDSVLVAIAFRGLVLWRQRFRRGHEHGHPLISLPFLRVELELRADVFAGEIVGTGQVAVRPFVGRWRKLVDVDHDVLVRLDPAVGEIGGRVDFLEPKVDHPQYGRSQLCTPAILRIHVDDEERAISDVGRLVKQTLFPEHPPFVFNTIACVGELDTKGRGAYTNPGSIWFNVFFGLYEIVAPKPAWSRPFGYERAGGAGSRIEFGDIGRLGKADWNYFSNWMYGVPLQAIDPYNGVGAVKGVQAGGLDRIGRTQWHSATVDQVECVSTYEAASRGASRLVTNSLIDDVWRRSFGLPNPQPAWQQSFVPTTLRAELHMAYRNDPDAYRTLIFGATDTEPVDRGFLDAQLAAIHAVVDQCYPDSGFP